MNNAFEQGRYAYMNGLTRVAPYANDALNRDWFSGFDYESDRATPKDEPATPIAAVKHPVEVALEEFRAASNKINAVIELAFGRLSKAIEVTGSTRIWTITPGQCGEHDIESCNIPPTIAELIEQRRAK